MKVLSLFSGIGAFEKALDNLGVPYELVAFCEIDKYASRSYQAIHGVPETMNLGDITKVDEKQLPNGIDLITYGFPCQDISVAGNQKGLFNEDGTHTRSGLFFEALRIIEETQPRVAIAENVKNLTGKRFAEQFKTVLDSLEAAGYNNYWNVLNAKDFGVPQNRERVFIVSIRKDIDTGWLFRFPCGFPLERRLKDVLEDEVDDCYYLSNDRISQLVNRRMRNAANGNGFGAKFVSPDGVSCALTTSPDQSAGQYCIISKAAAMSGRYNEGGVVEQQIEMSDREYANTITSVQKDSMVALQNGDFLLPGNNFNQRKRVHTEDGVCRTIIGCGAKGYHAGNETKVLQGVRIRKLTPKECFRLMGFEDADYEKAAQVNSNTQLYKQAGNTIVVPVVQGILEQLFTCGALERQPGISLEEMNVANAVTTPDWTHREATS